jgi:uncharacterized protein (TIGR04255 family)
VEALVDIHVAFAEAISVLTLQQIHEGEDESYPTEHKLISSQVTVDIGSGTPAAQTSELTGFRYISSAKNAVVQSRANGFAFSQLHPYTRWDDWQPEARRLWDKYRRITKPTVITRIAVRYINRINIGVPGERSFSDFLTTYPEIGPDLPQSVTGYVMQLQIPQPDMPGVTLQLSQGRVFNSSDNMASILLDLDLFRVGEIPVHGDDVWYQLSRLHERENDLFEACITDIARETFSQ